MERPYLLHMLTAAKNLSPFDVNMAYDAGWTACTPYIDVALNEVRDLVQDAIFSRGPKGVKRTGIFIGGRDAHLAMEMMQVARQSMVPPFEVSLFADPSGAFTTAAGMVACTERELKKSDDDGLRNKRVLVFGGTGPVGSTAAMLANSAGAEAVIISHDSLDKAEALVALCKQHYGVTLTAAQASDDQMIVDLLPQADVVFNAAKAGVQVLNKEHLRKAERLQVACDVNAVPPEGIEGVGVMDDGVVMVDSPSNALAIGALAVGNIKYQTQHLLLKQMFEKGNPEFLDFNSAFEVAREYVS
ncbi:MAG: NAD(P)-dependent methylenetetrahydromethanopterin dehydrogenase [Candidatus Thiodiazotropha taylori]|uniref:Methylenetetrahydromethanopterin dehydrogenase n=1 Tax=Candidatus Thiodiazotropha taylori TaxID=2792791 RepID=A0A9E4KAN4_9GAMM|nr:methylenetetrahydromethanopterin dehydrogenase [Candidatus Thiodiazotropha taylori]MCG7963263.1 methylenetetrahydromethanopterin dehydrogenase [Candidatus Thiodiazotropha endolucinida]RLW69853.1 MAG: methylenetetrahydromethanopterin dehydrogenase [gamma proteobacterium symbiont of Stewartia floridana]MCG7956699.1 methylenetetrahydromethanopterin dehydrogenase [Candidatus Thiodiazotropha taylori]MCG7965775.1 methylenetetrahydromethanopterin dehydrogenase [Candidatus Thiodiazotropha taylori]